MVSPSLYRSHRVQFAGTPFVWTRSQPSPRRPQQRLSGCIVESSVPFPAEPPPLIRVDPKDCICGEFILVIEKSLAELPRRQTDGATIIRSQDSGGMKAVVFKLNANPVEPVLVERTGGHERQCRFSCPRCNLLVGYQSFPPPVKSAPYLYILKGALTPIQGQVPKDAFNLEDG